MQSNENNENDIGSEENIINEIWRYKRRKISLAAAAMAKWLRHQPRKYGLK
jgi:hypothetical protein